MLTQVVALDGVGIKGNEQIVTGFSQFLNRNAERTTDNADLVVVL